MLITDSAERNTNYLATMEIEPLCGMQSADSLRHYDHRGDRTIEGLLRGRTDY